MIGNGNHTTYIYGDDWGMVYYCFTMFYPHRFGSPWGRARGEQAHNLPQVARDAASFRSGVVEFASWRVERWRENNWVGITSICQL